MKTHWLLIEGRVKGVGYRYFALSKAHKYKIKGTVENVKRGVEIYCQGEEGNIESFLKDIKKGPALSIIIKIREDIRDINEFENFRILH